MRTPVDHIEINLLSYLSHSNVSYLIRYTECNGVAGLDDTVHEQMVLPGAQCAGKANTAY